MNKPPPTFDSAFLRELAGGLVFKAGERLFESHSVLSASWESPVLVGKVKGQDQVYEPQLNLRSTVFADNRCTCPDGRKRKVCAHAIAAAIHYQACKEEQQNEESAQAPEDLIEPDLSPEPEQPRLKSIRVSEEGTRLRLLVFLPPNLEAAAQRSAIVVKLDAAAGREIIALNKLSPTKSYATSEGQEKALHLIESWCGGKLAALLQLTKQRLRHLLGALEDEPVVYWVKKPNEPIAWEGGKLAGVHDYLELTDEEKEEPVDTPATADPPKKEIPSGVNLREPSRPNPRQLAESKGKRLFQTKRGDFPAASMVAESMEGYATNRVVVDGSPNFLAVRLPVHDDTLQPLRELLKKSGFMLEPSNRKWWLRDRHKTLNFLAGHWRALKEDWQAEFTENFEAKFAEVELSSINVQTKQEAGRFFLDVSLSADSDEMELRKAIASGKSYVGREDGPITLLDRNSVDRLHKIEKAVSGQADRPFTPTFSKRLETAELVDVEDLLEEACEGWQPPQAWQSRSRALKQVGALEPAPVRPGFDAILRTYQRIGVAWLWHLYRNELGGILADEMGLGKTLQALALIECIRDQEDDKAPALVVCPASLVENWIREAARFTPKLKLQKHHGPKRAKEPVVLEDADLVITSYGTLRQDAELLTTMDWSVVIGDEAQHIKNRRSQNAKTLTRLHSRGRFLLTGTPVENSLDDLLSLFTFLMPGYLEKAAPKLTQEDRAWHNNRQTSRAASYILRRTKKEVAPELPDKIEKTFFCELGSKQQRFYQDTLEKTRKEIFNLEMSGANEGRLKFAAFTELLRLRQACVDPRILDDTFAAKESTKLAAFDEVLDECLDNGSRMLVFSSFVTALKLLAEHLKKKGHRYAYLDGSTKNRLDICDQFNSDDSIPVFLISLKAGGTGLNLTGADTVLHYDPWWNPAAEAQATDRAHRIGQEKVVTSIKLIATDTVEEKVLELQAKKAALLQELFEESEAANAKVSLEDIKGLLK
ncbi:ATP-dependent helicase [Coraliomargarita sinensis]|uniref:ATP-dependent helicase n=1 Tax=Coraliomargarita sinensis TaxID=2174842 RepID=A0A317ZHK6_9BACT|nr:DEAD/DEAH box helicase [Coraliomargarita sinensis]PXA04462.1 ATP-dependent helicase [Coraliomargarita sinensis]